MNRTSRLSKVIGSVFLGATAVQATHRDLFSALVPEQLGRYRGPVQLGMTAALGALGATFFVPAARPVARWATTTLLVASLPPAVAQVRNPEEMRRLGLPMPLVVGRIPVQVLMIYAVRRATRDEIGR